MFLAAARMISRNPQVLFVGHFLKQNPLLLAGPGIVLANYFAQESGQKKMNPVREAASKASMAGGGLMFLGAVGNITKQTDYAFIARRMGWVGILGIGILFASRLPGLVSGFFDRQANDKKPTSRRVFETLKSCAFLMADAMLFFGLRRKFSSCKLTRFEVPIDRFFHRSFDAVHRGMLSVVQFGHNGFQRVAGRQSTALTWAAQKLAAANYLRGGPIVSSNIILTGVAFSSIDSVVSNDGAMCKSSASAFASGFLMRFIAMMK